MGVEIRPLTSIADMQKAEALEQEVWQIEPIEVVPYHTLHALAANGSAVIGAFDGERLVGYVLGVLGLVETPGRIDQVAAARLKMYSVQLGVLAEYRNQGVGYQLKLAQREEALRLGIRLITWYYDPLESLNGRFNISKLGGICQTYHRHFHGEMGGINAGLPTDRFEVAWWVTGNRVKVRVEKGKRPLPLAAIKGGGAKVINDVTFNETGLPVPSEYWRNEGDVMALVEIPANFQAIKEQDPALAYAWRMHGRIVFETLFNRGYVVTDFVSEMDENGRRRSYYLLAHKEG